MKGLKERREKMRMCVREREIVVRSRYADTMLARLGLWISYKQEERRDL